MLANRKRPRHESSRSGRATPRRGAALVFVLVFVVAMAALAMTSIFMASNAGLFAKSYDKERDLKFAAELALQIGKSHVNTDPTVLNMRPGQLDTMLLNHATLNDANGKPIPGITVNVFVGPTGSSSGQFGRFSSIVAEARDQRGNGFIRRLELTQESFAKFAYWSNSESNSSGTIFFNNKDELWGPVWSNDIISIGTGGATFHDDVATAQTVNGTSNGTFLKAPYAPRTNLPPIALPSTASLNNLATIAGPYAFTSAAVASNVENSVLNRIEFIAVDLDGDGTTLQSDEGFFRYYTAKNTNALADSLVRGDWPIGSSNSVPAVSAVKLCGDYHWGPKNPATNLSEVEFFPAAIHSQAWFKARVLQGYIDHFNYSVTTATTKATSDAGETLQGILSPASQEAGLPAPRCFLAGDPHLVAVDRDITINDPNPVLPANTKYTTASIQKGGTDTTFTPVGLMGSWAAFTPPVNANLAPQQKRPWDGRWLFPIDRKYNGASKGVIYFPGNVAVSGVLNGHITLYTPGTIVVVDDIVYANNPALGVCRDILGLIAGTDIVIADNALNNPPVVGGGSTPQYFSLDDTKDMYINAVLMALNTSFRVENYSGGPTDVNDCVVSPTLTVNNGRGCIYLQGGIIQLSRGAVGPVRAAATPSATRTTSARWSIRHRTSPPPASSRTTGTSSSTRPASTTRPTSSR